MTKDESGELLIARWPLTEAVVRHYGGDPAADLVHDGLVVHATIRTAPGGARIVPWNDVYVFRLTFDDYDEHAPRIRLCNPDRTSELGVGRQFYPRIEGNNVFNHETFFCMPGDRRCYEQGSHPEWRKLEHYHPDVVLEYLFELLRSPNYKGRM